MKWLGELTTTNATVLALGGTYSMRENPDGTRSPFASTEEMFRNSLELREFFKERGIEVEAKDLMNKDSKDRAVIDWNILEKEVVEALNKDDSDGVAILQGTDTAGYTAQRLRYSIIGQEKPIGITGAQHPEYDGPSNIKSTTELAANAPFAEVFICFGKGPTKIWGSENIRKEDVEADQPYGTGEELPIGEIIDGKLEWHGTQPEKYKPVRLRGGKNDNVARIRKTSLEYKGIEERIIRPSTELETLMKLVDEQENVKSVTLYGYGVGNGPDRHFPFFEKAREKGITLVMCTQGDKGYVNMHTYFKGALERGVLPAGGWRHEEIYARLAVVNGAAEMIENTLKEHAVQATLNEKRISVTPLEMRNYLLLSGVKFRKEEDYNKHEKALGIPIEREDLLRGREIDSYAIQRGIDAFVKVKSGR